MEFTAENLEKAVTLFYQDLNSQSQLNLLLTAAQSSTQAWNFAWDLMDQTKPVEVQYFGASSLQLKISRSWHEISPDDYNVLREKLIGILLSYINGPKIVLNRLSMALASMILHSIPDKWATPLSDFISMLQQSSNSSELLPTHVSLLLEILTVLPEEFQGLRILHERKVTIRVELLKAAKDVLPILGSVISRGMKHGSSLSIEDESLCQSGIKCLSSWIQHGVGLGLEDSIHLVDPLLEVARNPSLSETALDAVAVLVNHPEAHRYPTLLMGILVQLLSLQDQIKSLIREGDLDGANQIYAVFAAFGESHSRLLLDAILIDNVNKDNVLKLVQLMLECTGTQGRYPIDEHCSPVAFSFWYILQDDICNSTSEKSKTYRLLFGPAYLTLTDVLLTKSMISDQSEWSPDDKEAFRCYRQDIADTLAYCYKFLRCTMMERLATHLTSTVAQCNQNPNEWPMLEACLHALKAIAENVEAEDELVPQILHLFGSIPYSSGHHDVVNTALETLGAYAEWLSSHSDYLRCVLPILLFGLTNAEVAPAATLALKDITRDCQMGIRPFAEQLLQGAEQALSLSDLRASEKIRLMYILGKVLSILPLESIVASLNRVVSPLVEELRILCSREPTAQTKLLLITRLKMLATLCTTLDLRITVGEESETEEAASKQTAIRQQQQPVLLIAQNLLPFLKGVVEQWGADEAITESICLVVKHTVSTLMEDSLVFLPQIAEVITTAHRLSPQTATLDVAKLVTMMYSQATGEVNQLVRVFLSEIIGTTLNVCGIESTPDFSTDRIPSVDVARLAENNDVLASFLSLLTQIIRKNPNLLNGPTYPIASLFYCGIVGLTRPESQTFKAATHFLVHFINTSRESPELVVVVQNQGLILISQLLCCIGGESPRALIEHTADVILALNKKYFDSLCRWLSSSLGREHFPSALVTNHQKEIFCRSILKERSNKRRLQDIVREFALQCRGLDGTEYSEQTARFLP